MSISKSLFSLAKNNNGKFKSVAQSKYILSVASPNKLLAVSDNVYGNTYTFFFSFDSDGITLIEKETKNNSSVHWKRMDEIEFWTQYNAKMTIELEKNELSAWIDKARLMVNKLKSETMSKFIIRLVGVTDTVEIVKVAKLLENREARLARIQSLVDKKQEQFENYWRA
jgi:carbohydrate-binding DOMON domain-containing protein